jgi:hypothetical protein
MLKFKYIFCHINSVIGNDYKASNYTPAITKKLLSKQRPLLVIVSSTQQRNGAFCVVRGEKLQTASVTGQSSTQYLKMYLGHPLPGGWKYGDLALKFETVKYGLESCWTQTREWLRWRGPTATANYCSVLSSETASHVNKPATESNRSLWLGHRWMPNTKTDWPTDRRS